MLDVLYFIIPITIASAAPLIFTAIGGVFSERSGVINIGLEGLMIMGAFIGILFNLFFADTFGAWTPWIALIVAMLVSALFATLHAIASISFRADQVVSGVAINMLGLAIALFSVKMIFGKGQTDFIQQKIPRFNVPFLEDIPIIGPMFFKLVYGSSIMAIAVAFIAWFVIYKTPFGLRLRSVGEHPMAADTMGIKVTRIRYIAVLISGGLAGIGGAVYSQTITNDFGHATINGQGFMALAAMIFGKWHPLGAMGAALFFGFAQALAISSSSIKFLADIPAVYFHIFPYVLTILALAGFLGKAKAPKALGKPYIKGNR
ncbi:MULTISPECIES: ABC transporter permease [unclassified Sporosarcina]|uniref:ABC transporter permease n=1 Tax=unclassified Sporosarcina TaxID=2647733 RepID=UPI000C170964|nr:MULTISPECIES: ABC transporter permease [unclassified Sporosarcina]PID00216.1 sugar ABC transporter permease [Sporosarcina sp. P29]PID06900.1 sugar ABC transporter permease [Sporosarcina sp. P30]PID10094.1 sugar ABC transporter permease [Sporosarcina sp. P31]PID13673.1 sugar ABC transporter permease [Sporosarcina sp. P32b]